MTTKEFSLAVYRTRASLAEDQVLLAQQAQNVLAAVDWLSQRGRPDEAADLLLTLRLPLAGVVGYENLVALTDDVFAHTSATSAFRPSLARWRGVLNHRLGRRSLAAEDFRFAATLASGDDKALCLINEAHVARELGDFDRSLELLGSAYASAESVHVRLSSLAQKSATQIWMGRQDEGLATVRTAAELVESVTASANDRDAYCYCLLNESVALANLGRIDDARIVAMDAVRIARDLGSVALEARMLEQLAECLSLSGMDEAALAVVQDAADSAEFAGDNFLYENCVGTRAMILWIDGRGAEAQDSLGNRSTKAANGLDELVSGLILCDEGDLDAATTLLNNLIRRAEDEPDNVMLGNACIAMSRVAHRAGDGGQVSRWLQRASASYAAASHWRSTVVTPEVLRRRLPLADSRAER